MDFWLWLPTYINATTENGSFLEAVFFIWSVVFLLGFGLGYMLSFIPCLFNKTY